MSNSFDPDKAQKYVRPDLEPNCLKILSADDTSGVGVKGPIRTAADDKFCDIPLENWRK